MLQILESGMVFGNFKPEQIFKIENSQLHKSVGTGVRTVEFILLKKKEKIFFVEAKSSSPKSETSWERYHEFLDEISEKFVHSFDMLCAWYLGRVEDGGEIGADLKKIFIADVNFVFVLVINGHREEWLLPLQEELNRQLRYHISIWKSKVIVMNEHIAKEQHLVL